MRTDDRTSGPSPVDLDDDIFIVDPDAVGDLGYEESPLVRRRGRGLAIGAAVAALLLAGVVMKIGVEPILATGHGLWRMVAEGIPQRQKVVVADPSETRPDVLTDLAPEARRALMATEVMAARPAFRWMQTVDPVKFCSSLETVGLKNDGWKPLFDGSPVYQCMTDLVPVPGSVAVAPKAPPAPEASVTDPEAVQAASLAPADLTPRKSTYFFSARGGRDRLETVRFKLNLDDPSVKADAERRLLGFLDEAAAQLAWSLPAEGRTAILKRQRYLGSSGGVTLQVHPETGSVDRINVVLLLMESADILAGDTMTPYPGPKPMLAPNPNAALLPADQQIPADPTIDLDKANALAAQNAGVLRPGMAPGSAPKATPPGLPAVPGETVQRAPLPPLEAAPAADATAFAPQASPLAPDALQPAPAAAADAARAAEAEAAKRTAEAEAEAARKAAEEKVAAEKVVAEKVAAEKVVAEKAAAEAKARAEAEARVAAEVAATAAARTAAEAKAAEDARIRAAAAPQPEPAAPSEAGPAASSATVAAAPPEAVTGTPPATVTGAPLRSAVPADAATASSAPAAPPVPDLPGAASASPSEAAPPAADVAALPPTEPPPLPKRRPVPPARVEAPAAPLAVAPSAAAAPPAAAAAAPVAQAPATPRRKGPLVLLPQATAPASSGTTTVLTPPAATDDTSLPGVRTSGGLFN